MDYSFYFKKIVKVFSRTLRNMNSKLMAFKNKLPSFEFSLSMDQKHILYITILTTLIYGVLLNLVFWSFYLSKFSIDRILSFGIVYHFIKDVFVDFINGLKAKVE